MKTFIEFMILKDMPVEDKIKSLRQKTNLVPDSNLGRHILFDFSKGPGLASYKDLLGVSISPFNRHLTPFPFKEIEKIYEELSSSKDNKILLNAEDIFLLKNLMNKIIESSVTRDKNDIMWNNMKKIAESFNTDLDKAIRDFRKKN